MHPVNAVSKVARSSGLERNWLLEACGSWISSDWICTNDALIIVVSLHIDAMVIPASLNLVHKSRSVVAEVRPTAVILATLAVIVKGSIYNTNFSQTEIINVSNQVLEGATPIHILLLTSLLHYHSS